MTVVEKMMDKFTDVFVRKVSELVSVQEEHNKKMAKENQLLRSKLTSLMKVRPEPIVDEEPSANNPDNQEPIWVNDVDLMSLNATFGPSTFGRTLAAVIFGTGEECSLINQRIGAKLLKPNSRPSVDQELELKMKSCIERKFPSNKRFAVEKAFQGANQYGAEMRQKFPWKKEARNTVGIES